MDKRYQVFLSSTYIDLKDERLEVMRALLELDCIPSGMEYFPATNDEQWQFIKDLIDKCDYYVVVIGARYGSLSNDGLSFTEKEYRYALEKGIPVMGFVHADPQQIPQGKFETNDNGREKLEIFRKLVRTKLCKEWNSAAELGAVVSRSLTQLMKRYPRPGWVRADALSSAEANAEILRLRQVIDKKDSEIQNLSLINKSNQENLAQGDDKLEIIYHCSLSNPYLPYNEREVTRIQEFSTLSWDEVFKSIAPHLLTPIKVSSIKTAVSKLVREKHYQEILSKFEELEIRSFTVSDLSAQMIIVQFVALDFINLKNDKDSNEKIYKTAVLSDAGRNYLMKSSAIKRGEYARAYSFGEEIF